MSETPPIPTAAEDALLGEIVLRNRLATRERLAEALELQQRARALGASLRLGEILLQMGVFDTQTLDALLQVQERLQKSPHPIGARRLGLTPKEDTAIGELALRNGLISEEQLAFALKVQENVRGLGFRRRIGEILVREGLLSEEAVAGLLQVQKSRAQEESEEERRLRHAVSQGKIASPDLFFGQVAIHHGFVTEAQVAEGVEVQRLARDMGVNLSLGEVLCQQKVLTEEHIAQIAEIQNVKKESYFGISMGKVVFRKLGDDSVGDLLCERRVLDPWQVEECVKVQKELGKLGITRRLGEIFLDKQYVSPEILYGVLDEQITRRAEAELLRRRRESIRRVTYSLSQAVALLTLVLAGYWVLYTESGRGALARWRESMSARPQDEEPPADAPDPQRRNLAAHPDGPRSIYIHAPGPDIAGVESATDAALRAAEQRDGETRNRIEARAQRALADLPADEFQVVLVGTAFPDGVLFEIFGQAPLPDDAEVVASLLYHGVPQEGGVKTVRVKNGLFYSRTGPLAGLRWTPPGLYTAVAEYRPPADGREARTDAGLRAACSAFLGTPEEQAELEERIRARHRNLLTRLEAWSAALKADLDRDSSSPAREDRVDDLASLSRELEQVRSEWTDSQRTTPISRFREADRRIGLILPAARRSLQCAACCTPGPLDPSLPPELRLEPSSPGEALIPLEELRRVDALLRDAESILAREGPADPLAAAARAEIERRLDETRALRRDFDTVRTKEGAPGPELDAWLAEVRRCRRGDAGLEALLADRKLDQGLHAMRLLYDQLEKLGGGDRDANREFWKLYDQLRQTH